MEAFLSKRSPIPKSRKIIEEMAKIPKPITCDQKYGKIGSGGSGAIYLQTYKGKIVARKEIVDCAGWVRNTYVRHLETEAITHKEVNGKAPSRTIELIEIVSTGEIALLMKLIEEQNVEEFLRSRQLEDPQKAALAIECAQAIAELHRSGIIHRDIKESNLFMGHKIIIGDFGTAKIEGTEDLVRKIYGSHPVGSPSHLAPEFQVMRDPSVTADIYAFGVILHRILSGENLIDENKSSQEAFGWHRHGKLGNRDLVGWKIVQACLEKDPKKRPGSMESVRDGIGEEFERAKIKIPEFCSE